MMNRTKLWAVGLIAATFVAGGAVGTAVTAAWGERSDDERGGRRRERSSYSERLAKELSLTATQQESVKVILDRGQGAMREIWSDLRPQFDTLRQQIRNDILGQLQPEQQSAYRELLQRSDSGRGRGRENGSRREH